MFVDSDNLYVQNLKRSVREAALSAQSLNLESSRDSRTDESSEHFFLPLTTAGFSSLHLENNVASRRGKRWFTPQKDTALLENHAPDSQVGGNYNEIPDILNNLDCFTDYGHISGALSAAGSNGAMSDGHMSFYDIEEPHDQVFSPPLLMDTSLLADSFEDLLGMLLYCKSSL